MDLNALRVFLFEGFGFLFYFKNGILIALPHVCLFSITSPIKKEGVLCLASTLFKGIIWTKSKVELVSKKM